MDLGIYFRTRQLGTSAIYTTGFIEVQNAEKDVAGRESLHRTPRRLTTAFGLAALPIDELHEMKTIC